MFILKITPMKKIFFIAVPVLVAGAAVLASCKKHECVKHNEQEPDINYSYNYESVAQVAANSGHTITNAGARLGRILFYDTRLSANNTIACASCHKQELAFSDNVSFSTGFNGGLTGRNSMPVTNVINSKGFFWDHRTQKLEDMVLQPIKHQVEMGLDNTDFLIKKLNSTSFYPRLFNEAFGSADITREKIGIAMAQFLYSMFASNSRADQAGVINGGGWGTTNNILTVDEQKGAQLFASKCTSCHTGPNLRGWGDEGFENIGLDAVYADRGLGALLNDPTKDGQFKIPSLRNVALTAPYMHDGRYKTLEEVVEHYNSGIIYSDNLSMMLRARDPQTYQVLNEAVRMNMSDDDKRCMVAFLKTLTDASVTTDPKFSDPFKK